MNEPRTKPSISDKDMERLVIGTAMKFFRSKGGDPEELIAAAWYYAGVAVNSFKDIGKLEGWINWCIWKGLLEDHRNAAKKHGRLKQHTLPESAFVNQGWDDYCRQLAGEVSEDLSTVIQHAMTAPGEVIKCLAQDGWSIPRILSALDEAREVLT